MSDRTSPIYADIPEQGPRIVAGLCAFGRDEPEYNWDHRPKDHDDAGLFIGGPAGEKVGWLRDINVGDANRAPTHETRGAALQRMGESRRRKLRLLNAIFGKRKAA
jgi:hypothetical protein